MRRRLLVAGGLLGVLALPAGAQERALQERGLTGRLRPTRVSLSAGTALGTYTASNNELIDGALRSVAVQVARPVISWRGVTFSYLGEVTPFMRVRAVAPPHRVPRFPDPATRDAALMARYTAREGFGIGLAPFGAEAARALSPRARLLVNVTAGAAWFSEVVPYGKATQANFTVAPGVLVERDVGTRASLAVGYALHHLSNASMGGANPGMNSHLVTMRWSLGR